MSDKGARMRGRGGVDRRNARDVDNVTRVRNALDGRVEEGRCVASFGGTVTSALRAAAPARHNSTQALVARLDVRSPEPEKPLDDAERRADLRAVGRRKDARRRHVRREHEPELLALDARVPRARAVRVLVEDAPGLARPDDEPAVVGPPRAEKREKVLSKGRGCLVRAERGRRVGKARIKEVQRLVARLGARVS